MMTRAAVGFLGLGVVVVGISLASLGVGAGGLIPVRASAADSVIVGERPPPFVTAMTKMGLEPARAVVETPTVGLCPKGGAGASGHENPAYRS